MTIAVVLLAVLALASAVISLYLSVRQRRLVADAQEREGERARLADQLITAEQDERRRIALFLHDGPVQSLAGIALMLDGVDHAIETGEQEQALEVLRSALARHADDDPRAPRPLLQPRARRPARPGVRDGGAARSPSSSGLRTRSRSRSTSGRPNRSASGRRRRSTRSSARRSNGAVRRGPPTRISVQAVRTQDGGLETVIADDAPGERRRATFDALAERARTLERPLLG